MLCANFNFHECEENGIENGNVFRILNMLIRILFYWNTFFFPLISSVPYISVYLDFFFLINA